MQRVCPHRNYISMAQISGGKTQIGPNIVSNKKNRFTSAAVIYLGAIVTKTNGMATQSIHIAGTIITSFPTNSKFSTKNTATKATISFPSTAEGTRFLFFADLTECLSNLVQEL